MDSAVDNLILIFLNSDLSVGYHYPAFAQLAPVLFLFIASIICLLDIACLRFAYSKRPILLYFISHLTIEHFIGTARRVQIECCIAVVHLAGVLEKQVYQTQT